MTISHHPLHFMDWTMNRLTEKTIVSCSCSRTRRTCKVQICDNTTRRQVGTYGGEQVHGAVQDHQFGTRLHTVHRTVQEWRSVLHLHVASHMVHLLTDLKEETLKRHIYYCIFTCYTNYCVTFQKCLGEFAQCSIRQCEMCLKSPETRVWTFFCKNYCYKNIRENSVVREYSDTSLFSHFIMLQSCGMLI